MLTGILFLGYRTVVPMMREDAVLFTHLDSDDAGAIVEKLKAQKVSYSLAGDGTKIMVPKDKVHELRLSLASEGLPRGGQVGFESFEHLRLGATEFEQHVTYRRAMEGELARTISTVRAVRGARVHLVLPKKSVFAQKREPASASVVLQVRGAKLKQQEVQGIVNLVASAVSGLEPERVTLITTEGTMLHRPKVASQDGSDGGGLSAAEQDQMAQTRALEALLEERTRTLLERVLGAGHVDVRVKAAVNTAKVERTTDAYDRSKSALRSEQKLVERNGPGAGAAEPDTVAGVPGAEANLPGGEAVVGEAGEAAAAGRGSVRRSHTRNYEIDRVQERRISVTQSVKRLAVAVVIDGVPSPTEKGKVIPRTRAELDKLANLVRSAVGFNEERGDEVTVESVPFFLEKIQEAPYEPPIIPIPEKMYKKYHKFIPLAKNVAAFFLVVIAALILRRGWKKRAERIEEQHAKELAAQERRAELEAAKVVDAVEPEPERLDYRRAALRPPPDDSATAPQVMRPLLGTATTRPAAQPAEAKPDASAENKEAAAA